MRVRTGATYRYVPRFWDAVDPPYGVKAGLLKEGDRVRVVRPYGCPPANTMGHAHIETLDGEFAGLVSTASLEKTQRS